MYFSRFYLRSPSEFFRRLLDGARGLLEVVFSVVVESGQHRAEQGDALGLHLLCEGSAGLRQFVDTVSTVRGVVAAQHETFIDELTDENALARG